MPPELISPPTEANLHEIRAWLQKEDVDTGDGFFCNWRVIESCFHDKGLHCIAVNGAILGFLAWQKYGLQVKLHICEIHPSHRGVGLGRDLMEKSLAKFESEGSLVAELECQPPASEPIWRRLGFVDFPSQLKDPYQRSGTTLYRPLRTPAPPTDKAEYEEVLELWSCDPWHKDDTAPLWTWEITREPGTDKLLKPIIFPCSRDWNVRWRKRDVVFFEEKMKYFKPESLEDTYLIYTHFAAAP